MVRSTRFRTCAIATVVAIVGALGASVASAAPPDGVSMEGTGSPPKGLGLFSKAAMAQKHCADNGRTWSTYEGGGPYCVNPWTDGDDNGGKTAQGVTATDVNVIAYIPNSQMLAATTSPPPRNLATGQVADIKDVIRDWQAAYQALVEQNGMYQLWGRTPVIEVVTASGSDEASQRADALTVIDKKPFMVIDVTFNVGGAPIFSQAVADKKILVSTPSTDLENATEQSPYRWNWGGDLNSTTALTAAFAGHSLAGKKAQWAGDALSAETRSFGAVYPLTGFDLAEFERLFKENGGKLTDKVGYDPATATTGSQAVGTIVSRLKSAGVTSVILFADRPALAAVMAAATQQDYFPEWVFTGQGYQELGVVARTYDAQQMLHAFGIGSLGPWIGDQSVLTTLSPFTWYWGSGQGNTWAAMSGFFGFLYPAMHYAGPTLTAKNIKLGLFAAPATSGGGATTGYGKTVGLPYDEYAFFGSDRALLWWDPKTTGFANATGAPGVGVWQYLNNGDSSNYDELATMKGTPKFFDPSVSVYQRGAADLYPDGVPTALPCTGCPSSGGSSTS